LVEWLRQHFGHRAENKSMPAWALGMAPEFRAALLSGYLSADGSRTQTFSEATTVSKAMAFSVKALAHSLGHTVTVYTGENTDVIEGRKVNARPYWRLRWRHAVDKAHRQTFRHAHLEWTPIRECGDPSGLETVFNIGVEEDESYVVEGIVVHNCKHFSKAKGSAPVSKKIRGLAWVALRWAATVRPRIIMLENVEEFVTWGPVVCDATTKTCRPCPKRKGREFGSFVNVLRRQGYVVEWRELRACDFGAPTIRKRLFLIARCDGLPICWPTPTHGDPKSEAVKRGKVLPWRTAAECIDWSIPCPSIFERKKPLAEATLRRIAKGVMRYVVDAAEPFIVTNTTDHPGAPASAHLRTVTTGGHHALVAAFLAKHYTGVVGSDLADPIGTVTAVDHHSLVTAHLIHMGHGEASSTGSRRWSHGIRDIQTPLNTLVKLHNNGDQAQADDPSHTVIDGGHFAEVQAFLMKYDGTSQELRLPDPIHATATKPHFGFVTINGEDYAIVNIGLRMLQPRELYLAQGFPADTIIGDDPAQGLQLTKEAQARMCGNSVSPVAAEALVRANFVAMQSVKHVA
jgi:DNA (cytosine-5)-methyltransferase 1